MGWFKEYIYQTRALLGKNVLQFARGWRSSIVILVAPVIVCLLAFLLQLVFNSFQSQESAVTVANSADIYPKCRSWNGVSCYSLMYSPSGVDWVDQVMQTFATDNGLIFGVDIVGAVDINALRNFSLANPNITQAGVSFNPNFLNNVTMPQNVTYTMFLNTTTTEFDVSPHLQRGTDSAVMKVWQAQNGLSAPSVSVSYGDFPKTRRRRVGAGDILVYTASLWFYASTMIVFIQFVSGLVYEKEFQLRSVMYAAGLSRFAYWTSWILFMFVVNLIQILVLYGIGCAFQFAIFLNVNFGVYLVVFVCFATAMMPLAMFLQVWISTTSTANTLAFIVFIIGFLLQAFLGSFGISLLYDPGTSPIAAQVFVFYAPFNFGKALYDMSVLAYPAFDSVTGNFVAGPGFTWANMYERMSYTGISTYSGPPLIDSIGWLWIDFAIFLVLALYFDNALPGQGGVSNPPWFFVSPSYWGFSPKKEISKKGPFLPPTVLPENMDDDLRAEVDLAMIDNPAVPLRITGLTKTFRSCSGTVKALRGLYLTAPDNSVLCLLGHNGAGKSTTINLLTGNDSPSVGDAMICGLSVVHEMPAIRRVVGVCPQHSVLWKELTSHEHMMVFGSIRGMSLSEARTASKTALAEVANKAAGEYSGGMQRRLSTAIACVGNPKVIFMDEPTTGLDPVSRHEVWEVVERVKQGRVVILTTHNMEEADALADRVAIMCEGRLKCVGNALSLKAKYGKGYRINIVTDPESTTAVVEAVHLHAPSALLETNTAGSLCFSVPTTAHHEIAPLFAALESGAVRVRDWGLSHTSMSFCAAVGLMCLALEDVFLAVTVREDELHVFKRKPASPTTEMLPIAPVIPTTETETAVPPHQIIEGQPVSDSVRSVTYTDGTQEVDLS